MSDALEIVISIAVVVGFAAAVCAFGDLVRYLTKGRSTLGAFHALDWLPALFAGVMIWCNPNARPFAWLYIPLFVAAVIYVVAFTFAAIWAGLPIAISQKVFAWFRMR